MPRWLKYALDFVLAFFQGFVRERERRQADVDAGAVDQQREQAEEDVRAAAEARRKKDEVDALSAEDLRRRGDRWSGVP